MIPLPDLLPISSSNASSPTKTTIERSHTDGGATAFFELITKPYNRSELDNFNNLPDIEIIKRDGNAIDKSIPHDIPADIELIPMSAEQSSLSQKRAPKRSFSPENTISKLSKLNDFGTTASPSSQSQSKYPSLKPKCSIEKVSSEHFQEATGNNTITMSYNTKISHKVPKSRTITETVPSSVSATSSRLTASGNITIGLISSRDSDAVDGGRCRSVTDDTMAMDTICGEDIGGHLDATDESKYQQHSSNDSSEYSDSERMASSGASGTLDMSATNTLIASMSTSSTSENIGDGYDHQNASDNLSSGGGGGDFCSNNDENSGQDDGSEHVDDSDGTGNGKPAMLDSIFKIQNFEGVLQIQPHSLILEQQQKTHPQHHDEGHAGLVHLNEHDGGSLMIANNIAIGEDSSNSTAALADCSGDNSADTAVEELEPTIHLEPIEDDPIEQKFTDAENYVLESGEISGDSGGKLSRTI